jgi:GNAT superfamily N-acetyltransferase
MSLRRDDWLSKRLGKPAFQGESCEDLAELPPGPAFVGVKVPVFAIAGVGALEEAGFRLIDTNVQLERAASALHHARGSVRFARPTDESGVRAIAEHAFVWDRFHRDPLIGATAAAQIKADWAGNFFAGVRGDWMVVAGTPGKPEGFLQLLRGEDGAVVIDLIAVSPDRQGAGLGRAMIAFAVEACLGEVAPMRVGTQIANMPSLALYGRLGFRIISAAYVLHLHR